MLFIVPFTHRRQPARSTAGVVARSKGGAVAKTTKPSSAPAQPATTRRQRPNATNVCARQQCELEPRYHYNEGDQIYTEMDN